MSIRGFAGIAYDLTSFENTLDYVSELLRFQKWYSHLTTFLEWRLEYLRNPG